MTELQKTEFEILKVFVEICNDLDLPYFLVCGSALGAAKYGGFIPWDDDIDVGMPREAYDEFCSKAQDLLPKQLFLQNSVTDPSFPAIYSKIRNSETTYIEKSAAHLQINHGIYIDVFPLDGYPSDQKAQNKLERKKKLYSLKLQSAFKSKRSIKGNLITSVLRFAGCHKRTAKTAEKYTRMISAYPVRDSEIICNHGNWQGKLEYSPSEQYGEGIIAEFEGLHVRIPLLYDRYLTQKYGNWRGELPKEEQIGHHYYDICDTERPYPHYIGK